jgi:hypothetical protein
MSILPLEVQIESVTWKRRPVDLVKESNTGYTDYRVLSLILALAIAIILILYF